MSVFPLFSFCGVQKSRRARVCFMQWAQSRQRCATGWGTATSCSRFLPDLPKSTVPHSWQTPSCTESQSSQNVIHRLNLQPRHSARAFWKKQRNKQKTQPKAIWTSAASVFVRKKVEFVNQVSELCSCFCTGSIVTVLEPLTEIVLQTQTLLFIPNRKNVLLGGLSEGNERLSVAVS